MQDSILINKVSIFLNDVWLLSSFQSNLLDSPLIIILWAVVSYILGAFFLFHILKSIIYGILTFILHPITIVFLILLIILSIWTYSKLDEFSYNENINNIDNKSLNVIPSPVMIEKLDTMISDSEVEGLEKDKSIEKHMEAIKKLNKLLEEQKKAILNLKNN